MLLSCEVDVHIFMDVVIAEVFVVFLTKTLIASVCRNDVNNVKTLTLKKVSDI